MDTLAWPDSVDEILGGDQAVALAHTTPARGVVITPLTNFGLRDREAGTLSALNSSVAMWQKLDRLRRSPQIALAYHTRRHGFSDRPEYVLVQGRASLSEPDPRFFDSTPERRAAFERFAGGNPSGWAWLMRAWHERVEITVAVERIAVWPDLACSGEPTVYGARLPDRPPDPQSPPKKGTAPRVRARRAARLARRLPNVLLGWVGADGFPVAAPVELGAVGDRGIDLRAPAGLVPPGGRRAGLTAHSFHRHVVGHEQHVHTGWLEAKGDGAVYAPHTRRGYLLPPSKLIYKTAAGVVTRQRYRQARRAGVATGAAARSAGSGP